MTITIKDNTTVMEQKTDFNKWRDSAKLWEEMDCRTCVFFYKEDVW